MRIVVAAIGLVLVLAACSPSGAVPVDPGVAPTPGAPRSADDGVQREISARVVVGEIPVSGASLADHEVAPRPTGLTVPALGIAMDVIDVGLDAVGGMELPDSAADAGWFRAGGNPGGGPRSDQNAVIAAHVDDAEIGRGPFAELRGATPGDRVEVVLSDGSTVVYEVDRVQQTSKREVDFSVVFGAAEGALVLVTCGGRWDADVGHYDDNVLVWAYPEDGR